MRAVYQRVQYRSRVYNLVLALTRVPREGKRATIVVSRVEHPVKRSCLVLQPRRGTDTSLSNTRDSFRSVRYAQMKEISGEIVPRFTEIPNYTRLSF